jgi:MFS transporter, ACS family, tartrate transporter
MTATASSVALEEAARQRIARRLLPFLFVLFLIAYLDRVNVGYAALEITRDLGFSDRVIGLGSGIFFLGYLLLEIPGSLLVERWSARKWFARIMVTWGVVTMLTAFIRTPGQFYTARVLLGTAESGFFPGVIVYLSHWFRQEDRAKAAALFMTALPVANIVGAPLAGWLLGMHWLNFAGWRWLFVVEGIPAIVFGIGTLFYLTDWPREARWLSPEQREWIATQLESEKRAKLAAHRYTLWEALRTRETIRLTLVYFFSTAGAYGLVFWLPTILKRASHLSNLNISLLAMVPYMAAFAAVILNGWHSDRTGERRWHTAVPLIFSAIFFLATILAGAHFWIAFAFLVAVGAGVTSYYAPFWALPTLVLSESAAAASIGLINSFGNLGSLTGPYVVGYFLDRTKTFVPGFIYLIASLLFAAALVLTARTREAAPTRSEAPR